MKLLGNAKDFVQVTKLEEIKPVRWNSWSLILGWPVQSIWESGWSNSTVSSNNIYIKVEVLNNKNF